MYLLIIFLVGTFVTAGTSWGQRILRRRGLYVAGCVLFAGAYYSLRVIQ